MADDKRDGDDLFEDLDKFFAPIKDVDWDEPASAGRSGDAAARSTSRCAPESRSRRAAAEPADAAPRSPTIAVDADDEDEAGTTPA